ncbi:MAG: NAD(P)H-binding protein, partial [bacterium]|nr:NAD(P)H-binding protein [bacterium]
MERREQGNDKEPLLILLTGVTGYIGGRLLPVLVQNGVRVRCMARNPAYLAHQVGANIEVVAGDVMNPVSLAEAMRGVHTAYYLIHSMSGAPNFEESDRTAARNFVRAAAQAGVKRIIYLGGLGNPEDDLSPHLRSRQEVGAILQETEVECIEFRASIIIGSGSL